jgi:peptide chain release factor 2
VDLWRGLHREAASLTELAELVAAESAPALEGDVEHEVAALEKRLDALEFQLVFSGRYDSSSAIFAVHAGAGGTESQDWAEMLLRMYLRWAEQSGYRTSLLDSSRGDEAGIKSATVEVVGANAYGWLKGEKGVHRLVRLSPYDAAHARHTSFALVEVLPEAGDNVDVEIRDDDLRIDYFRSSGAGGQNVQKTSTAVRIVHLPTGITIACQNERSQRQNRETAMKVLKARLIAREEEKRAAEMARIRGEHVSAEWGNQIRSYVLHPYKLVKDHRSGYESHSPQHVLDGELEPLLKAYLLSQVGKGEGQTR